MERRLLLAISLMIAVAVVPTLFLKRPVRPAGPPAADSARATDTAIAPVVGPAPVVREVPAGPVSPAAPAAADTVSLTHGAATYRFTTAGAAIAGAVMADYATFNGDDTGRVQLVRAGDRIVVPRLVVGADTVRFDDVSFGVERAGGALVFTGRSGPVGLRLSYAPVAGRGYLLDVTGELTGLEGRGALLVVGMGSGFANVEADSVDNYRHYALSVRRNRVEVHNFRSLDPGEREEIGGPFDWVAVKSKYFIGALLSPDSTRPLFGGAVLVGAERPGRMATLAQGWATLPVLPDGRFRFQLYLGPQRHVTLSPLGRELDKASPYGWIFRPIVMPVSGWITRLFLWMHQTLSLGYGWVLVIFGVMVRLVLWPLNQKAMKSQVAMMAVQPILQDLQKRYKNDPAKLQQEMMKVYKEHKVNPLGGCLPLLLPLPVLLALFFVFANTIELRGAPFLWLPDLALRDPLYVVPVAMGGSMFLLSKLSMSGMPPNPQAKMMMYVMPVMMTVFFVNFASGLNLYYAVSNLVSLPQQWLINKSRRAEMARRQVMVAKRS